MNQLKLQKKIIIPNLLLAGALFLYVLTFYNNLSTMSVIIYFTFFINFTIVITGILKSELAISINKINWYFFLIFLIIIPFYQLNSGYAPRSLFLTEYEIVFTNVLIMIWCVGYYASYNLKSKRYTLKGNKSLPIPKSKGFYLTLFFSSLVSFVFAVGISGLENLFIRDALEFSENTFGILIFFLTRSTPALSIAIFLWAKKKKIKVLPTYQTNLIILILLIITIILNNPITLSRFLIGAVYLGLLISAYDMSVFKGKRFDILLIFSIVIIFPLMYAFKFYTLEQILSPSVSLDINNYNSLDFDAYQMIGRTIRYVEVVGYQYGSQLRSVLLFFMPRDIWDVKGLPSGELVATFQNVSFTNLSSPIVAEGFIDFGIIGVLLYSLVFGRIAKFIDYRTHMCSKDSQNIYFIEIVFSFILGFFVFIYRGALQPSFLRLMGFLLFLMMLYAGTKLSESIKNNKKKR